MDFSPHSSAHLSDVALRLPPQVCEQFRRIQPNTQEIDDLFVIQLLPQDDLPQMRPIRQIMHPEQAVAKEIIKLSTTDLPKGWAAHAVRYDAAIGGCEIFHGRVAAQALKPALLAHPALILAVIPADHGLEICCRPC